ncbi:MAG: hypothetical protein U1F43_23070 [Myxococcota bacterium]
MKVVLALLVLSSTAATACDKKGPAPAPASTADVAAPAPAPADVAAPAAADVAAAAPDVAAPHEDEAAKTAQCARILAKSWRALAPGLAKAGITATPELEKEYLETGYETRRFLEGCPTVSKAYRDCMEAAALPIENADPCHQSVGADEPQLGRPPMPAPSLPGKAPRSAVASLFDRPPLSADAAQAITARLVGTWTRQERPGSTTTWTISAGGDVVEAVTRDGQAQPTRTFVIRPTTDTTVSIVYPSNEQTRGFRMLSDSSFVCEGNLMWTPSYMGDGKTFVVRKDFDAIFYDNGTCQALTNYGNLLPATCTFSDVEGKRYFEVAYQVPGVVRWGTTEPQPTQGSFLVSGEYLVPTALLESPFVK